MTVSKKQKLIPYALQKELPELVLKNANVVDVFTKRVRIADVAVQDGVIVGVGSYKGLREIDLTGKFLAPGFIDSHVHMESSMVSPRIFADKILSCGTTTVIADPHEIVNVAGLEGLEYMLCASEGANVNIYFMLPSCVPINADDHNGAVFTAEDMKTVAENSRVRGLGEVMSYPAIFAGDEKLLEKLSLFTDRTIDGHAPSVSGAELQAYRLAGVETDHECSTYEQALERIQAGFVVQVREGSAARNLEPIISGAVADSLPLDRFVFCTDDLHLEDVEKKGHINHCVKKAVGLGADPVQAICCASLNAARLYGLKDLGAVAPGYRADFLVLNDLHNLKILDVYKDGKALCEIEKNVNQAPVSDSVKNSVHIPKLTVKSFMVQPDGKFPVIGVIPGEIVTKKILMDLPCAGGVFTPGDGLLKIAVIQRHDGSGRTGVGVIKGFGLKNGAIASTVAHDSHNLIVVGSNDYDMLCAVNELRRCQGGYTVCSGGKVLQTLTLPVAGLFTDDPDVDVVNELKRMSALCHEMGVGADLDPFQNLSFVSLPVIPEIRLMDNGIFDVVQNKFIG